MTDSKSLFCELNESFSSKIIFGDDFSVEIKDTGKILMQTKGGSLALIANVFYVLKC